jgi:hypothetical protein
MTCKLYSSSKISLFFFFFFFFFIITIAFCSEKGGLSQPYSFCYLFVARIKQGIVGYIGLG